MLERMRAVRAHHEQELEEQFIRIAALAVTAEAVLGANLAELARPVGQDSRKAGIGQPRISGVATSVKAATHSPATVQTIVDGGIQAEGALCLKIIGGGELITRAPDQLASEENGVVDGAAQGFPAERGVRAIERGQEVGADLIMTASVRCAEIEVRRFVQILVSAKVADNADVLAAVCGEDIGRIAAEDLRGALEEPVVRPLQEARQGEASIVDAILPAHEIVGNKRPINKRERMVVDGVHFSELGAHLA